MTSLIEQLGIDTLEPLKVAGVLDQITAGLHGYDDNGPVRVSILPSPRPVYDEQGNHITPSDRAVLHALDHHKIIVYKLDNTRRITDISKKTATSKKPQVYNVYVTNRHLLEQLVKEFDEPYIKRSPKPIATTPLENIIYYNPTTGDISINGTRSKIKHRTKYKNRAVFGLLLRHSPRPTPRDELLKTLKLTSKTKYDDTERTYKLNHAIDNLRNALKVTKDIISLKADGVYLNAIVVQVEQLPEDFRFTD